MSMDRKPVYYGDYINVETLTSAQSPESAKVGEEAHDEMLFIIVHQVYELWFKQILHEFNSIVEIFNLPHIEERKLATVSSRLERVKKIQGLLLSQLDVMETMTPMDFLEFRDLLIPASGFQSVQFREIEVKMGLSTSNRHKIDRDYFLGRLNKKDQKRILEIEKGPSLLNLLEGWLERIPFLNNDQFDFWKEYRNSISKILKKEEKIIENNLATLSEEKKKAQLQNIESTKKTFESFFDESIHKELISKGDRSLSQKAMLGALFILLYRDEPMLNGPYRVLLALMDVDENFTAWRYRHALMAHRMLGTKIGTGGSSGHEYLKAAAENNRVFLDLFNLSTFLVPRSELPVLPREIKNALGFHFKG